MPIAGMIRCHAQERPDHIALKWDGGSSTYAQLHQRSSRLAQAFSASGVRPRDRVAVLDYNGPAHVEVMVAAAKLRAVAVSLNFRLSAPELLTIVNDSQARVLVVGAPFKDVVDSITPDFLHPIVTIPLGESYESWLGAYPDVDTGGEHAPDDTCIQLYSSGTTGTPKGVEISALGLKTCISLYEPLTGLDGDAIHMMVLPFFHIGGTGMALATHLTGGTNYVVQQAVPEILTQRLARERCTHTTLVPAVLQSMLQVPGIADMNFDTLKSIAYGGSPITETLLRQAIEVFGCEFLQAYGLTESCGTVAILPPSDHDPDGPHTHRLRSIGKPVPSAQIRVVDPETLRDVATHRVGEIWIKSPQVMKGYWGRPDQTAETIIDGWLRSGDAGYLDDDGYIYLYDRVKDMIISGGENIYPAEVENALASHPAVLESAVIGVPSQRWGETPKAIVVRRPGADVTQEALLAHCRRLIASYKCPTSIEWADALPRNAGGKILKKELRAPYWAAAGAIH
jgi:long-chain acyl-CoA synthetase